MKLPSALSLAALIFAACGETSASGEALAIHAHGPHDGLVAPFQCGEVRGYLELKLHDDKGDLELWLAGNREITTHFDLPSTAVVEVRFVDKSDRVVELRPRNADKNEDEAGNPNMRDGTGGKTTNYFIFPGDTGKDASWLQGADHKSTVVVSFTRGDDDFVSQAMTLQPHEH